MKLTSERRWVLGFAIFILVLTSLPYLYGYFNQGSNWQFTGFVFGVDDSNSYIAKIMSGAAGNWLFRSPYSPYEQRGFLAFTPYILMGKLGSNPGLHEQLVAIFQIYRWFAGIFVIMVTYELIANFIMDENLRRWGVVLATVGGGLGWLSIIGLQTLWANRVALEFFSPETFGFLSIYGLPHLAMARGLLLLGYIYYLRSFQNARKSISVGLTWLLMGFFQPLTIVTGWALLFTHIFFLGLVEIFKQTPKTPINWKHLFFWGKSASIIILISSPFVIYNYFEFALDPYLSQWYKQNIITSPPTSDYLLAFGVLLPFVVAGVYYILKKYEDRSLFLLGWLISFPLLAYAPYNLQRRLPDGIWVGLVVLALIGIGSINKKYHKLLVSISSLAILPTIVILAIGFFGTSKPQAPEFIPLEEASCFKFISQNTSNNDVIMASYKTSNPLPAWSASRVITGLGTESTNNAVLDKDIYEFYQTETSDQIRIALLKIFDIRFIIWGPEEKKLGEWNPDKSSYLSEIYNKDNYVVFKVELPKE